MDIIEKHSDGPPQIMQAPTLHPSGPSTQTPNTSGAHRPATKNPCRRTPKWTAKAAAARRACLSDTEAHAKALTRSNEPAPNAHRKGSRPRRQNILFERMGTRKEVPHPKRPKEYDKKCRTGVTCAALRLRRTGKGSPPPAKILHLLSSPARPLPIAAERNPEAVYFTHTRPHQTFSFYELNIRTCIFSFSESDVSPTQFVRRNGCRAIEAFQRLRVLYRDGDM